MNRYANASPKGGVVHRDVERDPRVGDLVRVIPELTDAPEPPPMEIIDVDDQQVTWLRDGEIHSTPRAFWSGERIHERTNRLRLLLLAQSVSETNKYLQDPQKRAEALDRNVRSSSAIDGINISSKVIP